MWETEILAMVNLRCLLDIQGELLVRYPNLGPQGKINLGAHCTVGN